MGIVVFVEPATWNDKRLDDLSARVDSGFVHVDEDVKEGFANVDARLVRLETEMRGGFVRVDREMKEGFARVDGEMKALRENFGELRGEVRAYASEMKEFKAETYSRFNHLDASIGNLKNVLIAFSGSMIVTLMAGLVAIVLRIGG